MPQTRSRSRIANLSARPLKPRASLSKRTRPTPPRSASSPRAPQRPPLSPTSPASQASSASPVARRSPLRDIEDLPPPAPAQARHLTALLRAAHPSIATTPRAPRPLLDVLVSTILSQATSRSNSTRAFARLKSAYPTWADALAAGEEGVEPAIRLAGLSRRKAAVICDVLRGLRESRGELSLEFLRDMDVAGAKEVLCSFRGVGVKTAACVMMFGMNWEEFPVDTHVWRILRRVGWVRGSRNECYEVLNKCLPGDIKFALHVLLIEHGRQVCLARKPKCAECTLRGSCERVGVAGEELDQIKDEVMEEFEEGVLREVKEEQSGEVKREVGKVIKAEFKMGKEDAPLAEVKKAKSEAGPEVKEEPVQAVQGAMVHMKEETLAKKEPTMEPPMDC